MSYSDARFLTVLFIKRLRVGTARKLGLDFRSVPKIVDVALFLRSERIGQLACRHFSGTDLHAAVVTYRPARQPRRPQRGLAQCLYYSLASA
jgi:hypothetical protein